MFGFTDLAVPGEGIRQSIEGIAGCRGRSGFDFAGTSSNKNR